MGRPLQLLLSAMGVILLYRLFSGFAETRSHRYSSFDEYCGSTLSLWGAVGALHSVYGTNGGLPLSDGGVCSGAHSGLCRTVGCFGTGRYCFKLEHRPDRHGGTDVLFATTFLIPLTGVFLALTVAGAAGGQLQLTGFAKTLKKVVLWVFGLLLTVFVGVVTIRSFVSSAADGVSLRTGKYLQAVCFHW